MTSPLYPGGATYTYDVLDNITRTTVAGRDHVYWYDASNRLTKDLKGTEAIKRHSATLSSGLA